MARVAPKDLASAVAAAKPGDRIALDAGELVGRVVIDKPLVIEGRGAGTWLGNHTGPVLHIRSSGVELRDLHVELTGDLQHPAILVEECGEPALRDVTIRRGELRVVRPRLRFATPPPIRLQEHTPSVPPRTVSPAPAAPERPPAPPPAHRPVTPAASGSLGARRTRAGYLLGGIALAGGLLAVVLYLARPDAPRAASPAPDPSAEPAPLNPGGPSTPYELLVAERAAIALGDEPMLAALIAPDAFGFGTGAWEVAYSGRELAKLIARALGTAPAGGHRVIQKHDAHIGIDRDVAWIADDLEVSGVRFATTQLAVRRGGRWSVAAWHWAILVSNRDAFAAARSGTLPELVPLRQASDSDGELHAAFRTAFSSKAGFLAALGDRADMVDLGSAPGERSIGGAKVRAAYAPRNFDLVIRGDIAVGRVTPRAGWGAATVEYTVWGQSGIYTVPYRVLAVMLKDGAAWRIVLSQWSNGAPVPASPASPAP